MWCYFFYKQKTAYDMRISDWSSDVCSSDLRTAVCAVGVDEAAVLPGPAGEVVEDPRAHRRAVAVGARHADAACPAREQMAARRADVGTVGHFRILEFEHRVLFLAGEVVGEPERLHVEIGAADHATDRKSTRLNSSH